MIETIDFVPAPLDIWPTRVKGDDDFWGPPLFDIHAWLENRGTYIRLLVEANWREPKPDYTTFTFTRAMNLYDIHRSKGPGWVFDKFDDQYDVTVEPVAIPGSDGGIHRLFGTAEAGLVHSVDAVGDSYGGWFGGADHPYAKVFFNRVRFDVRK
jgi:hypothetical protein